MTVNIIVFKCSLMPYWGLLTEGVSFMRLGGGVAREIARIIGITGSTKGDYPSSTAISLAEPNMYLGL